MKNKNNYPMYNYFFGTFIDYAKLIELQSTNKSYNNLDNKKNIYDECSGQNVRTRSYIKKRESKK